MADYIAKFGHEPATARPWGVENEMSKGHLKQARNEDGYTPFALLAAISDGIEKLVPLWQEYCSVFKGRKQLNYSPGLKKLYAVEDPPDEELAGEVEANETLTLVELMPAQWDQVVEARARGGLLELAHSGRVGELLAGLAELGIEASPPDMVGWRVHTPGGDGEVDWVRRDLAAPGGWRVRVWLDGPPGWPDRFQVYALWDVVVLGSGERERAALLAELDKAG